ncbi:hypothetical protein BKA93DRAFT_479047 [Sparassis latifolia]
MSQWRKALTLFYILHAVVPSLELRSNSQPHLLLHSIVESSPYLRNLHLRLQWTAATFSLLPITGLIYLRDLSIFLDYDNTGFDCTKLQAMAALKELETLSIRGMFKGEPKSCCSFAKLRELRIDVSLFGSCRSIKSYLGAISAPHLRKLAITICSDLQDVEGVHDCMTAIYGPSLCEFQLSSFGVFRNSPFIARILALFGPLLRIRNLVHVCLDCNVQLSFSDDDAKAMATAWPGLKRFHVDTQFKSTATLPSALTLAHFARGCPVLEDLELQCMRMDNITSPEMLPVQRHPLRMLSIENLPGGHYRILQERCRCWTPCSPV